jgi:hypothetical protein
LPEGIRAVFGRFFLAENLLKYLTVASFTVCLILRNIGWEWIKVEWLPIWSGELISTERSSMSSKAEWWNRFGGQLFDEFA